MNCAILWQEDNYLAEEIIEWIDNMSRHSMVDINDLLGLVLWLIRIVLIAQN